MISSNLQPITIAGKDNRVKLREILTWKFLVYQMALPLLGKLGPKRADSVLSTLGRILVAVSPARLRKLSDSLERISARPELANELAGGELRFLSRDYLLEGRSREESLELFDVEGEEALLKVLNERKGVVLVGSHFGAHIAAFHWFYDQWIPIKLMVQRPKHITKRLERFFDADDADPQSNYFLSRALAGTDCVKRLLHARNALKSGKAIYLAGDIPWQGGNTRTGQLLGRTLKFLSVWADLAANTQSPVFLVFCSHREGGRFSLKIEPFGKVETGSEPTAIKRYLERLDSAIMDNPGDAVAHLLWPCFGVAKPSSKARGNVALRPSRNASPIAIP